MLFNIKTENEFTGTIQSGAMLLISKKTVLLNLLTSNLEN
jgi:hypothetical protein